jgi:hypothetical protein
MLTSVPGVVSLEAKRDPTCYVDLDGVLGGPQARQGFYLTLGSAGVGVGITLWGAKTKRKGGIIAGLLLAGASAAGAVYFHREYQRYKNAERCGLNF